MSASRRRASEYKQVAEWDRASQDIAIDRDSRSSTLKTNQNLAFDRCMLMMFKDRLTCRLSDIVEDNDGPSNGRILTSAHLDKHHIYVTRRFEEEKNVSNFFVTSTV